MAVVESVGKQGGRFHIVLDNVTTNDEESSIIDLMQLAGYPKTGSISLQVYRKSGATDVVDIILEMSNYTTNFTLIAQVTSVAGGVSGIEFAADKVARFAKIRVPDVGSGNVLRVDGILT